MNRFLKAGGIPALEFLFAKYGKGGGVKDLGGNIIDLFQFKKTREDKMETPRDEPSIPAEGAYPWATVEPEDALRKLREQITKVPPLQQLSEEDIAQATKINAPGVSRASRNVLPFFNVGSKFQKPSANIVNVFTQEAAKQYRDLGNKGDKVGFIEQFMDYGVDFDTLDDMIFAAEKIPAKFRVKVDDWPEYSNLRMGYIHAIEEALQKSIKESR